MPTARKYIDIATVRKLIFSGFSGLKEFFPQQHAALIHYIILRFIYEFRLAIFHCNYTELSIKHLLMDWLPGQEYICAKFVSYAFLTLIILGQIFLQFRLKNN